MKAYGQTMTSFREIATAGRLADDTIKLCSSTGMFQKTAMDSSNGSGARVSPHNSGAEIENAELILIP